LQFIGGLVDTFFIHVSFPLLTGVDEAIRCQAVHNAGQAPADRVDSRKRSECLKNPMADPLSV